MYRIVSVTDKNGKLKKDFMDKMKAAHPSLEGEILNEDLLQSNMFLGNLRFKWNDDSGKMLATSYVIDCNRTEDKLVVSTMNSVYTLELVKDDEPAEEVWSWTETEREAWDHGVFTSRQEAIEDALKYKMAYHISDEQLSMIKVVKCQFATLPTYVSSEDILDALSERFCMETGSEEDLYDGVPDEDIEWLEDKLSELICEFNKRIQLRPRYYSVLDAEEVVDLVEYRKQRNEEED